MSSKWSDRLINDNSKSIVFFQPDSDISDYTYERTLKMEERSRILQSIRSKKSVVETDLQMHMDDVTRERKLSKINEEDTVSSILYRSEPSIDDPLSIGLGLFPFYYPHYPFPFLSLTHCLPTENHR